MSNRSFRNNLRKTWKESRSFKAIILIGGVLVAVIGLITSVIVNMRPGAPPSAVVVAPAINERPGEVTSPAYRMAVEANDQQRAQEAKERGESAVPMPISGRSEEPALSPLEKYKSPEPAPRHQEPIAQPTQVSTVPDNDRQRYVEAMQKAMARKMKELDGLRETQVAREVVYFQPKDAGAGAEQKANDGAPQTAKVKAAVLLDAGTVELGYLDWEANSDVPGSPVVATVRSGPFEGAKVTGGFQAAEEFMLLKFDTLSLGGESYQVDAVAVDPATKSFAMADDVNHHYMRRVVLPAAAALVSGFGEISSRPRSSIVLNGALAATQTDPLNMQEKLFGAVGRAAETTGNLLEQEASGVKSTVRNFSGKQIGILFLRNVEEKR